MWYNLDMNGTQRRETFIALRARKEGYLIASEILNPHLNLPQPAPRDPAEVKHVDEWDYYPPTPSPPPSKLKVATLVLIDLALLG